MPLPITLKEDPLPSHQEFMDELKEKLAVRNGDHMKEMLTDPLLRQGIKVVVSSPINDTIRNMIFTGHAFEILKKIPDESIDCVITSPPYWGLRDYGLDPLIWGGDPSCEHEFTIERKLASKGMEVTGVRDWLDEGEKRARKFVSGSSFCNRCGAWRGSLGLEPDFHVYVDHLKMIFVEVKRVLKNTGTIWLNIGDTFASKPAGNPHSSGISKHPNPSESHSQRMDTTKTGVQSTCLCGIPERVALMMTDELGFIRRNSIVWYKKNAMPSSVKSRFTVDFEYVYFFTKSNKAKFWTNDKNGLGSSKKPRGMKGVEGVDWDWYPCKRCDGKGCSSCKGIGKKKRTLWKGHSYYFEQQFEPLQTKYENYTGQGTKDYEGAGVQNPSNVKRRILESIKKGLGRNKRTVWKDDTVTLSDDEFQYLLTKAGIIPEKGVVWTINTRPFPGAHFAVFPTTLIEPMLEAGCPREVCTKCGVPRMKVYDVTPGKAVGKSYDGNRPDGMVMEGRGRQSTRIEKGSTRCDCEGYDLKYSDPTYGQDPQGFARDQSIKKLRDRSREESKMKFPNDEKKQKEYIKFIHDHGFGKKKQVTGFTGCDCNSQWEPGIVLDPFLGSGTVPLVAKRLGMDFIGIELNPDYVEMAWKRLKEDK